VLELLEGVPLPLGVALLLPVSLGDAPADSDAVGEALTEALPLTVGEGVPLGVGEAEGVGAAVSVPEGVAVAEALQAGISFVL
jgi:hypothetical protein